MYVGMWICYLTLLLTYFLAIIVICLNHFFMYVVLNYHVLNFNFIYFTCYIGGMFQSWFPITELLLVKLISKINYYIIL